MTKGTQNSAEILLVEDNFADAQLLIRFLEKAGLSDTLHWVADGDDALDYLFKQGAHVDASSPRLVLLDLNLPRVDGREVLKRMRAESATRTLPVIVLTTSQSREDILEAEKYGILSFISKPSTLADFQKMIQRLVTTEFLHVGIEISNTHQTVDLA